MFTVYATLTLAAAALSSVSGVPVILDKRIAQVISDSTQKWEQACLAAGGGQSCNPLSIAAFSTLLAAPPACAQQDAADNMIDLAHQLNNNADMISLTQIFAQQPRNSPDSLSVLYCQVAPRNQELAGLFQCQFQGVNDNVFTGQVALGAPGTFPLGHSSALSPPGSCPANPGGKIADGTQLDAIVNSPGSVSPGSNNANTPQAVVTQPATSAAPPPATTTPVATTTSATTTAVATTAASDPPTSSASGFQEQNGKDAQALNVQFATLTEGTSCTPGFVACVDGKFAQCPFGTVQISTACAAGTSCFALPLVNSPGTSVTCTTDDDAASRFAAAGVSGGFDGNH